MNQTPLTSPNLDTSWEELRKTVQAQADQIKQLQEQLEAKSCRCHLIDPSKMRILLWINRSKQGKPETCVLKIAEQRLLGLPRSDRRGERYWRFDEIMEKKPEETPETPTSVECYACKKTKEILKIKCWECQAQMEVIGEPEVPAPLVCLKCEGKKKSQEPQSNSELPKENNEPPAHSTPTKRQELKEQIQRAIEKNKAQELPSNESSFNNERQQEQGTQKEQKETHDNQPN